MVLNSVLNVPSQWQTLSLKTEQRTKVENNKFSYTVLTPKWVLIKKDICKYIAYNLYIHCIWNGWWMQIIKNKTI